MNVLKSVYMNLMKVKLQRITVVKYGIYKRRGNDVGCFISSLSSYIRLFKVNEKRNAV